MAQGRTVTVIIPASSGPVGELQNLADKHRAMPLSSSDRAGARGRELLFTYKFRNAAAAERFIQEARMGVRKAKAVRYEENPSREANTAIGGGVGAVVGAVLLGLPGALIGGAIGGVIGASRGDTRRALGNPRGRKKDA